MFKIGPLNSVLLSVCKMSGSILFLLEIYCVYRKQSQILEVLHMLVYGME